VFTGLEHGLAMTAEEVRWADDELAPAIYADRLRALTRLGALLRTPDQLTTLLFGDARGETSCSIS
jgi:hypothetical protein